MLPCESFINFLPRLCNILEIKRDQKDGVAAAHYNYILETASCIIFLVKSYYNHAYQDEEPENGH